MQMSSLNSLCVADSQLVKNKIIPRATIESVCLCVELIARQLLIVTSQTHEEALRSKNLN